jgi:putative proteasome-type protease
VTYCLAIKVEDGLIALADSRVSSGSQVTHARKVGQVGCDGARFLIMTSGLRSVRDKTMVYVERALSQSRGDHPTTMLEAVALYAKCLRRVAAEDRTAIEASDLKFDLHSLVCGRLPDDPGSTVYLVYPEGNWIEIVERTPYLSIGATAYGKPILDRALRFETPMLTALKLAYLSFDSTRTSSMDVGYPIDILTLCKGENFWREAQFDYEDLQSERSWWNEHLTDLARRMPVGRWVDALLPDGAAHLSVVGNDEQRA